jgi:GNAT superfamily N-acetyltransferase
MNDSHAPQFVVRAATLDEVAALEVLIRRSIRTLGAKDYTAEQIEDALRGAFGVDTQLIHDGTYFVVEHANLIVACGGWSKRRTLFGGDARSERDAGELDPAEDAAKIRAFFVAPEYARRGLGRLLLDRCESAARQRGFSKFELMATLPGVRLYAACGYVAGDAVEYALSASRTITFVPMTKRDRSD